MGSGPGGESSWWGIVLVGSGRSRESSWGVVLGPISGVAINHPGGPLIIVPFPPKWSLKMGIGPGGESSW